MEITSVCVDYRHLNQKTVKDRYPLPLIEDQINKLAGAKFYTTVVMKNGLEKFLSVAAENGIQNNWQNCKSLQRKVNHVQ